MTRKRSARPSVQAGRASVNRQVNTDSIAEHLQREWERGCFWAGIGLVLTFGPMLAWGIYWGW